MDPKKDDQSSETKPWDQSFGDDRDAQGNLSRTKRHRQSHNNRLITIILVAIIILIAVGSLIYGLARQSAMNKPDNSMSVSSEQTSSVSSTPRKKAAKSASEKAASSASVKKASADSVSKARSSSKAADTNRTSAEETKATSKSTTPKQSATTTKSAKSTASSSGSTADSKYAVVEQGQGLYRVAVNNGISVARLKQLNPGLNSLRPNQRVRVK
ncbi:LysM peptidoglycan-binding domain-containing protein [Lactobacillus sp. LC28-10]|uniref:LysM peptidoglycan-binding domain-containing protein n=1 Tax=Secundilactobacillus angelensis TaxID=2722706 RepID=A0ABX1L0M0_9LACO|nr:LysM domain-containing protein [Secundilactobacillus angelensis]MCH5461361.1 LysM domain-containing protein [Secundilactobacillus angelensis]NLR17826.1 LysM peptidoglycan-binding domain-containing protein [Secundilactobacillus angelensis]